MGKHYFHVVPESRRYISIIIYLWVYMNKAQFIAIMLLSSFLPIT